MRPASTLCAADIHHKATCMHQQDNSIEMTAVLVCMFSASVFLPLFPLLSLTFFALTFFFVSTQVTPSSLHIFWVSHAFSPFFILPNSKGMQITFDASASLLNWVVCGLGMEKLSHYPPSCFSYTNSHPTYVYTLFLSGLSSLVR